jgi:type III pantothenate kinase
VLLALDARNRAISVGFLERGASGLEAGTGGRGRWLLRRRLGAVAGRSADEYALLLSTLAQGAGAGLSVDSAWMSSVAPSLSRELCRAVATAFGLPCSLVGPGVRTGVRIRSDVPSEVGSDLICSCAAARELAGGACVVVDFDAAIAFSAVGRSGDFLGAAIAPGVGTAAEALRGAAALLPEVALPESQGGRGDDQGPAIGKNTAQSIRAGLGIGYAGLVERIVRRQREELAAMGEADSPESVVVIGTGDEEGRLLFASLGLGRFVPDLVLEGLAIIAGRASPPPRNLA